MPLFTRDNAREMARRGNLARWSPENRAHNLPQPVLPQAQAPAILPAPLPRVAETVIARDDFAEKRLARVRKQLARVDDELEKCSLSDSKRVKELGELQKRLSDQEFALANRPFPGNRKPRAEPTKPKRESAWLVDVVPLVPSAAENTPTGSVPSGPIVTEMIPDKQEPEL
jgi:hypothetical protein